MKAHSIVEPHEKARHQLSSTGDPSSVSRSRPAASSRIHGQGRRPHSQLQPRRSNRSCLPRTRVPVGSCRGEVAFRRRARHPLSARALPRRRRLQTRFHSLRTGIQQREDALHRLVDVWATGEAAASLGFAAAPLRPSRPCREIQERTSKSAAYKAAVRK